MAQIIPGYRGFKFVQTKGIALIQGEKIAKDKKYTEIFFKLFSSEPSRPNSIKLNTHYTWVKGI
jgi:hypothetical protein